MDSSRFVGRGELSRFVGRAGHFSFRRSEWTYLVSSAMLDSSRFVGCGGNLLPFPAKCAAFHLSPNYICQFRYKVHATSDIIMLI